jgi:hypothetical protein
MRAAVIFVLFLVFQLLGEGSVRARAQDRSFSNLTALKIEKQQVKNALPSSCETIPATTALEEQKEVLVSVEDDEEELVRRTTIQARYFPLLSCLFVLRHPCPSRLQQLSVCNSLFRVDSRKYIEQRVLRI